MFLAALSATGVSTSGELEDIPVVHDARGG
jgi:hypothetical protein